MTESPSDAAASDSEAAEHPDAGYADEAAAALGALSHSLDFDTIKVRVAAASWTDALAKAKHGLGLVHFSYLSAIDWANDVQVGDPPAEAVEERFEILAAVADLTEGKIIHISTDVPKDAPSIATATGVYAGASWHEREANEMFGIDFVGHPNLEKLYLPTDFEGHPLSKEYPLLAREVKPWPGTVDVEGMPETEEDQPEAAETTPAGATTENPGR